MKKIIQLFLILSLILSTIQVQAQAKTTVSKLPIFYVGNNTDLALKKDGTVWRITQDETMKPTSMKKVSGLSNIVQLDYKGGGPDQFAVALRKNGTVSTYDAKEGKVVHIKGLTKVKRVYSGGDYFIAEKKDGTYWIYGDFNMLEKSLQYKKPTQIKHFKNIKQIETKYETVLMVRKDGTVWVWGKDAYNNIQKKPVRVDGLEDVASVHSSRYHHLALKKDGTVWAWNYTGYLEGNFIKKYHISSPTKIERLSNIVSIQSGIFSLAIDKKNNIWQIPSELQADGRIYKNANPTRIKGITNVKAFQANDFNIFQKKDGSVWYEHYIYNKYGEYSRSEIRKLGYLNKFFK